MCRACDAMAAMQILIFAGSTRQQSHNRRLAAAAAGMARELGAQPTLLELSDFDIPMYNADLEASGTPPDVLRFKAALHSHPAWLICSPEYNGRSEERRVGKECRSRWSPYH